MNKTVNINLAGNFYHIDEDAYVKLQHYLDAIKRSFTNTPGAEEIISDIEARIAELFAEKLQNERQVISMREVEEVIAVMGQPEDYMVDEEIFEDTTTATPSNRMKKRLFRDTEHSYVGGVSSGLGHYLGISALWVRLLWIILTIGSSGAIILIYIAMWIFVPEAKSTADKLAMRGEPVNITNIERKIKEGFDDVSGRMKNIDYEKYGYKAKSGAGSAATAVGDVIKLFLKIFVKLIGIFLILIAGFVLIGLFIGLFTVGTFGIIDAPWADYIHMVGSDGAALWLISLLGFFLIGIPFFFLFILGLKILVKNLKSIGRTAKLVLLGLWIISFLGLVFFGIQQATERAIDAEVFVRKTLPIKKNDTLYLNMRENTNFSSSYSTNNMKIQYDKKTKQEMLFSSDVRVIVRPTQDSVARMEIIKSAQGKNHEEARIRAENIIYNTGFSNNSLELDQYLTTNIENKFRDQEVEIRLYLPVGSILYASQNTHSYHGH
ncbi:MAG TPA: PspC domain-containing protein, partial [Salinimicrobium sp.]|nr:PspC domain-containing protein [Salinimicrobium sp.]